MGQRRGVPGGGLLEAAHGGIHAARRAGLRMHGRVAFLWQETHAGRPGAEEFRGNAGDRPETAGRGAAREVSPELELHEVLRQGVYRDGQCVTSGRNDHQPGERLPDVPAERRRSGRGSAMEADAGRDRRSEPARRSIAKNQRTADECLGERRRQPDRTGTGSRHTKTRGVGRAARPGFASLGGRLPLTGSCQPRRFSNQRVPEPRSTRATVCRARRIAGGATAEIGGYQPKTTNAASSRNHSKGQQDPSLSGDAARSDYSGQHPHRGRYQPESTEPTPGGRLMKNLRGPQRNKNVVVQNRERQRAALHASFERPLADARGSVLSSFTLSGPLSNLAPSMRRSQLFPLSAV